MIKRLVLFLIALSLAIVGIGRVKSDHKVPVGKDPRCWVIPDLCYDRTSHQP